MSVQPAGRPLNIAHRGARSIAPENTLAAFRAALEAGADGIEFDVQACATGEILILHDDAVDRTTNGTGILTEMPFYAVRSLDAGSWFGEQFAGERIPTLQEALDLIGRDVLINIEIKNQDVRGRGVEEEVAAIVRSRGMEDNILVSSFNPLALARLRRAEPKLARALLYSARMPLRLRGPWSRWLSSPSALHPQYDLVTEDLLQRAHAHGLQVNAWTVNEPGVMERLIALGVDGIITDYPQRLAALLARGAERSAQPGGTSRG